MPSRQSERWANAGRIARVKGAEQPPPHTHTHTRTMSDAAKGRRVDEEMSKIRASGKLDPLALRKEGEALWAKGRLTGAATAWMNALGVLSWKGLASRDRAR